AGNTFVVGADFEILGSTIDQNTVWNIGNVDLYRLLNDVIVQAGATLTVGSGETVQEQDGFDELYVRGGGVLLANGAIFNQELIIGDSSGGSLNTSGATFTRNVTFGPNGLGTVQNGTVSGGQFIVEEGANPTIAGMNFQTSTPVAVVGEFVDNLAGNTFVVGADFEILGSTIDQNTVWNVGNVDLYRLLNDVIVRSGATLTIGKGNVVQQRDGFDELYVDQGGNLQANGVVFNQEIIVGGSTAGQVSILNSTFTERLDLGPNSSGSITFSVFASTV
ncbi:MAG: hypothetical protein KDA75_15605, partial [Planctomycetaceae bacterium]|nr:hypothetical protein [Planctomycetaceae bacterium]